MGFYAESDFAPDVSIGYLVRRVHQLGGNALEPVFAAEGLTGTQSSALVSIWFERYRYSRPSNARPWSFATSSTIHPKKCRPCWA